ncbi:TolC family protein [Acuticoccus sp. M5D2P5]|uniref:TolC family protein n=1 Tax=Acuticoccus kalidii TaxID=2910977 RepID=UPI001F32E911|nr:TolC family protein [Acuticoccus kalidii]
MAAALLGGCAANAVKLTSGSPSEAWAPNDDASSALLPGDPSDKAEGERQNFGVPGDQAASLITPPPQIKSGEVYELPELIDMAARNNPATRLAWDNARQAALAVGLAEATFLPSISANVIGGAQVWNQPLPVGINGKDSFTTTTEAIVPALALEWLIFDFGQRRAARDVANHNAFAANIEFNGMHQQVIYDVAIAYYRYGAAESRLKAARQTLANSRRIADAADARMARGLGTSVEVAQARQQVAQSNLRVVEAEGVLRDSYQGLLGAMGISPMTRMKVGDVSGRRLPRAIGEPTEAMIANALSQRPDVLAAYSRMKASEAGIRAAEAEFRPKVYLSAIAAGNNASFSAGGLPGIGQEATTAGVLVGVTIPIYSGGIRAAQLEQARTLSRSAATTYQQTQDTAVREIVIAADTLRTALASYHAASELTRAASITYDAALESYRNGLTPITDATVADSGLLDARQAQADAHAASLVAASSLAFALGAMTSREAATRIPAR